MNKYFILSAQRIDKNKNIIDKWNYITPRQLIKINGETLLERTVRLIHEKDKNPHIVYIVSNILRFKTDNSEFLMVNDDAFSTVERMCQVKEYGIGNHCTFLYGDVFYSEECIQHMVESICKETLWFGRTTPSEKTKKPWGEVFGFCVSENYSNLFFHNILVEVLNDYNKYIKNKTEKDDKKQWPSQEWFYNMFGAMDWGIYNKIHGKTSAEMWGYSKISHENFIEIDDITDDFDYIEDLQNWEDSGEYEVELNRCCELRGVYSKSNVLYTGLENMINNVVDNDKTKIIVEVGGYIGEASIVFSKYFQTVYCIDTWNWMKYKNTGWIFHQKDETISDSEKDFDYRTRSCKNIVKIKSSSLKALENFPDSSLDFVYININHDAESYKIECESWYKKIKKGGFIGGYAYDSEYTPGVKIAVDKVFNNIIEYEDRSWLYQKI